MRAAQQQQPMRPREGKLRMVYVVSTWWPKIDGASISVMGHVRHMANVARHPVLVVRPQCPDLSLIHI